MCMISFTEQKSENSHRSEAFTFSTQNKGSAARTAALHPGRLFFTHSERDRTPSELAMQRAAPVTP